MFFCIISLFVPLFLCQGIADAAEPGLIAYWPLDGDAEDATGGGNDGAITGGVQWVEGVQGQAAQFDNGSIDCGNDASLQVSPMSCMFWMKPLRDLAHDDVRINLVYHAKGPMFAYNNFNNQKGLDPPPGIVKVWVDTVGNIAKAEVFTKRTEWEAEVWYHLACTYDEKELVVYVDGVEAGRSPADGAIAARTSNFAIGSNVFPGGVDEVKLYDRALTAGEVVSFGGLAVEPADKLTSAWGDIKAEQE